MNKFIIFTALAVCYFGSASAAQLVCYVCGPGGTACPTPLDTDVESTCAEGESCRKVVTVNGANTEVVYSCGGANIPDESRTLTVSETDAGTLVKVTTSFCNTNRCNAAVMEVESQRKCYACGTPGVPVCVNGIFNPNEKNALAVNCPGDNSCIVKRTITGAAAPVFSRECGTDQGTTPVFTHIPAAGATPAKREAIIKCRDPLCNVNTPPSSVSSCYKCTPESSDTEKANCKKADLVAGEVSVDVCSADHIACETVITEDAAGVVTDVGRKCAAADKTIGCAIKTITGGARVRTCYCNDKFDCNSKTEKIKHTCLKCTGDVCKPPGFVLGADGVETADTCPAEKCQTIITQKEDAAVAETVERGCAPADRAAGCVTNWDTEKKLKTADCVTEGANSNNVLSPVVTLTQCYTCNDAAKCAAATFDTTAPEVAPKDCLSSSLPCVTIRHERLNDSALVSVERRCASLKETIVAGFSTNDTTRRHTLLCSDTTRCNTVVPVVIPFTCHKCGANDAADLCPTDQFAPAKSVPVTCPGDFNQCLTVRTTDKDGKVSIKRDCAEKKEDYENEGPKCTVETKDDIEILTCQCEKANCNKIINQKPEPSGSAVSTASVLLSVVVLVFSTLLM